MPKDTSQTTHEIETEAGRLFVRETGEGRPCLLWPSIFADGHLYDEIASHLPGLRLILIDGPGHGRSGPARALSLAAQARGLMEVAEALALERAVIGGTSWGGIVAAHAARAAPERVSAALLINTPLELGTGASLQQRFIAAGARWIPGMRVFREGVARSFFTDPTLADCPDYAEAFHGMLKRAEGRAMGPVVRSVLFDGPPLRPLLPEITVPTLMIAGREDGMYPLDEMRAAAATLPNGRFAEVPGRHISVVDAPGQTAHAIRDFLECHPA
ncbi:MAG: alpha/beta hydrolase [Pseudomonadota bacterium]